ncbi:MAG: tail fiber protein [Acidobacteriia bacterium]|nr:tail fiber protein [Terriglobia bacterium]
MADQFVAEIRAFPFNFPPRGWALCDGQLMAISQNTALFSLLGTFYGGDGKSTFGLPNLQGNVAIGQGQGPGLSDYFIGESGGTQNVTLLLTEMAMHQHSLNADVFDSPDNTSPANAALANGPNNHMFSDQTAPLVQMAIQAVTITGSSLPHNNMMPYLTLNFCIALQGVFPARG